MSDNDRTIQHIDLTPTPQGVLQIERLFRETINASRATIKRCEHTLLLLDAGDYIFEREKFEEETTFLMQAIEAYISQERYRIASMIDGLQAMGKTEYE